MTYANLVYRFGWERFAQTAASRGERRDPARPPLGGVGPWCAAADAAGVETVMLAAPTAPDERLGRIVRAVRRGSSTRSGCSASPASATTLAATAKVIAARLKEITDMPVLVGCRHRTPSRRSRCARLPTGWSWAPRWSAGRMETRSPGGGRRARRGLPQCARRRLIGPVRGDCRLANLRLEISGEMPLSGADVRDSSHGCHLAVTVSRPPGGSAGRNHMNKTELVETIAQRTDSPRRTCSPCSTSSRRSPATSWPRARTP